jgi:CheY-like chemotaxis protein
MEPYARALPRKRFEIVTAWNRWRESPHDPIALQAFRLPVHRLAGSALTHGFGELGRLAAAVDRVLVDWVQEPADVRDPAATLLARLGAPVDALLAAMALAREPAPEEERRSTLARPPVRHGVLLVEDDPEQALAIAAQLRSAGFDVRAVETSEAMEPELAADPPDIIVLDYWLADETAADVARGLVRSASFGRIPRVCLTADASDVPRAQGLASGFTAVVHKSVPVHELAAILRNAIHEARRR